jgi:hypothetical protein
LAPEAFVIKPEHLSPYSRQLAEKLNVKPGNCQKLVSSLHHKERYVIHYRNLKMYVRLGMRVTKIHRVMSFTQSRWLKPYIDFNTEQRKLAKNEFEKDFFKLMNNAVFGKTLQNDRKHMDVKLVADGRQFRRLTAKPNFKSFKIFTEDLVAVNMRKTELKLIRPCYVGVSILDISKVFMYSFHYDVMRAKYGDGARLLMTDTDSLVYEIATDDVYADMLANLDAYDTSDYSLDHPCYSAKNKKVLGKMKDEYHGHLIKEFVGLRPKMYSILDTIGGEKRTAKGIKKRAADVHLRHRQYYDSLFNESSSTVTMQQIRSNKHELHTLQITKSALSSYDDKRFVLADKASTLAHGHYRIGQ